MSFAGSWSGIQAAVYVSKNADYWVVSRLLGGEALGLYYIAYVIPNLARQRLHWVAQAVFYPVFSRLAEDDALTAQHTTSSWCGCSSASLCRPCCS